MALTTYCTQVDVENLVGSEAFVAWTDDDRDGVADSAVVTAVLEHASNDYNRYVRRRYTSAQLAPSGTAVDAVRLDTAILAAYRMATRRGEPAPSQLQEEFERLLEFLRSVRNNAADVPGVSGSKWNAPTVRNFGTDLRRRTAHKVIQTNISNTPDTNVTPRHIEQSTPGPRGFE